MAEGGGESSFVKDCVKAVLSGVPFMIGMGFMALSLRDGAAAVRYSADRAATTADSFREPFEALSRGVVRVGNTCGRATFFKRMCDAHGKVDCGQCGQEDKKGKRGVQALPQQQALPAPCVVCGRLGCKGHR